MVISLEQGADLHMVQLMPLPLTVSCFSKIQIGFTFLIAAYPGSPGQRAIKRVCLYIFLYIVYYILLQLLQCLCPSNRCNCRHYVFMLSVHLCVRGGGFLLLACHRLLVVMPPALRGALSDTAIRLSVHPMAQLPRL